MTGDRVTEPLTASEQGFTVLSDEEAAELEASLIPTPEEIAYVEWMKRLGKHMGLGKPSKHRASKKPHAMRKAYRRKRTAMAKASRKINR